MIDVAPGLRVRPHAVVHRRDQQNLRLRREEAGAEEIVGETVRGTTDKISGSRSNDYDVRLAREPEVI
jgi:hypothetical protein